MAAMLIVDVCASHTSHFRLACSVKSLCMCWCILQKLPQVLPLETLKTFMSLGVDPPKTNDDVPKAIEVLEAKKREFEAKRDKAAIEPPSEEVRHLYQHHHPARCLTHPSRWPVHLPHMDASLQSQVSGQRAVPSITLE